MLNFIKMKTQICYRYLFAVALASSLGACAHTVEYPLSEADRQVGGSVGGVLKIERLVDDAPATETVRVRVGDQEWRSNARSGYRDEDLSAGVSHAVARHFEHSGLFDRVVPHDQTCDDADYRLTGRIYDYSSMGQINGKAEKIVNYGTMLGSVPGAAATLAYTARQKANVSAHVELRDVKIEEQRSRRIPWSWKSISRREADRVHFLKADTTPVYQRADRLLGEVVGEMIDEIGESVGAHPGAGKPRPVKRNRRFRP